MSDASAGGTAAAPSKLRGFGVRFLVGAWLVLVVAATLVWFRWGFIALLAAFVALGAHELGHAASLKGWRSQWGIVAVGGAALVLIEYGVMHPYLPNTSPVVLTLPWYLSPVALGLIGCALIVMAAWGWRLRRPVDGFLADAATSALMVAYLPMTASFAVAMVLSDQPVARIATFIACIALNDSGAYIMGSWLGRHKMAPHISPAKTWEGFAGGVVWAGVAGALLVRFALPGTWWQGAILGVVLGCWGTLGDLVESAIKRDVGVKDMGKLLPGHGGAMDRLDSLLFCAPVAWAMLTWWILA